MEKTDIELKPLDKESARPEEDPDNNNVDNEDGNREVNRGNGNSREADPSDPLLQTSQGAESNGGHVAVDVETPDAQKKPNILTSLRKDLNEPVFGKIKLWMAILILLVFVISIVFLLIFLCSGQKDDADDKYDRASFVVPLDFMGSFRIANYSFVQDPMSQAEEYNELFMKLRQKLTQVYKSSPALERYFSLAQIETMRGKNGTVEFKLEFMMPEENKLLKRYTLSREMVYHVLLQNLFDQDTEDQLYIEPSSLSMEMMDN